MKSIFLFLLIFLSSFILTLEKENETLTSTIIKNQTEIKEANETRTNTSKEEKKENYENQTISKNTTTKMPKSKKNKHNNPPPLKGNSTIPNDTSKIPNDIFSLNDLTFDMVLRGGKFYKWLVILYSETCGHCEHARREIRKIFQEYKNSTSIRFAEIEINKNHLTNMRFDIEGVPYIFMLQNESIYELDLFPNQKNLKKFIETDFNEVEEELKPFPRMVPFYQLAFVVLGNILRAITNMVNDMLFDFGYEYEFTPMILIISFIGFIAFICILEFYCCAKFCPDEDKPKRKKRKKRNIDKKEEEKRKEEERKKEEEKKREEEIKKEENEEYDEEEEEEEDDDDINKIEEEKKRIEEEKKKLEKEMEKLEKKKEKSEKRKKKKDKEKKDKE